MRMVHVVAIRYLKCCSYLESDISMLACMLSNSKPISNPNQWQFQSCQFTREGDTRGARGKLMGGEKSGPSPYPLSFRLVCCPLVVLTVGRLCPIVPQANIVLSNKHNWPEFYPGNAWACPGLEPPVIPTIPCLRVLIPDMNACVTHSHLVTRIVLQLLEKSGYCLKLVN